MKKTKAVLIVGGSGYIGTHLALHLRERYKVFATFSTNPLNIQNVTYLPFDIFDRDTMKRTIYMVQPNAVIYCAGKPDILWAEENGREAERVHAGGAAGTLAVADILQPKFIYLSSCYVFDGQKGNYVEDDIVLASTALGKSKLSGENFIKGKSLNYLIIRSAPVFGRGNGKNISFIDELRKKLGRGERVELPNDETFNFSAACDFAKFVGSLVDTRLKNKIIHFGGLTKVTYYEFALLFAERYGFDKKLITPQTSAAQKLINKKIINDYSLNFSYAAKELNLKPFGLEESFNSMDENLSDTN